MRGFWWIIFGGAWQKGFAAGFRSAYETFERERRRLSAETDLLRLGRPAGVRTRFQSTPHS
jgi:hypothetical protein